MSWLLDRIKRAHVARLKYAHSSEASTAAAINELMAHERDVVPVM
jgi:hypothetical protein